MAVHLLFSYGTLQRADVQRDIFGGVTPGEPDAVVGHRLGEIVISDPHVIDISGKAVHPVLITDETPGVVVTGTVFTLTDAQLAAADDYEVDAYRRQRMPLRSGREAWVYVLA